MERVLSQTEIVEEVERWSWMPGWKFSAYIHANGFVYVDLLGRVPDVRGYGEYGIANIRRTKRVESGIEMTSLRDLLVEMAIGAALHESNEWLKRSGERVNPTHTTL